MLKINQTIFFIMLKSVLWSDVVFKKTNKLKKKRKTKNEKIK